MGHRRRGPEVGLPSICEAHSSAKLSLSRLLDSRVLQLGLVSRPRCAASVALCGSYISSPSFFYLGSARGFFFFF